MKKPLLLVSFLLTSAIWAGFPARAVTDVHRSKNLAQGANCPPATITAQDLPSSFIEIPPANLAPISEAMLQQYKLIVEDIFLFVNPLSFEFILGVTTKLSDEIDREARDSLETLDLQEVAELLLLGNRQVGEMEVLEQKVLTDVNDIGDNSAGVKTIVKMRGVSVQVDMVMFHLHF